MMCAQSVNTTRKNDRIGQIKIYVGKCFRIFLNENRWICFVSALVIMLIISLATSDDMFITYRDTRNGSFAVICACIWTGLFNSIQSVCSERKIIKREHRSGLHISSYTIAHALYELFLSFGEAIVITVILFIKNSDNLPENGIVISMSMDIFFTIFFVIYGADVLALLISCIVKSTNTAMTVMPFVLIIQLIMSGAIFQLDGFSEKISDFTLSKWGLNGIMAVANTKNDVYMDYIQSKNTPIGMTGCEPEASTLWNIWALLILFILVYLCLGTLVLKLVDKDKR